MVLATATALVFLLRRAAAVQAEVSTGQLDKYRSRNDGRVKSLQDAEEPAVEPISNSWLALGDLWAGRDETPEVRDYMQELGMDEEVSDMSLFRDTGYVRTSPTDTSFEVPFARRVEALAKAAEAQAVPLASRMPRTNSSSSSTSTQRVLKVSMIGGRQPPIDLTEAYIPEGEVLLSTAG